jgi:hypothetical protein
VKVAVLASNPALRATWTPESAASFDVIIAVNIAATLFPCDWWVAGDAESFDRFRPIAPPRRGVVTDALNYRRGAWWPESGQQVQRWCEMRAPFGNGQWHTSGPAAIGFAAIKLKATQIHAFGMDMAGTTDLDGRPACQSTGAHHRWTTEARQLADIVAATGVLLIRHLAGGTFAVTDPPPPPPMPGAAVQCGWCGRISMRPTPAGDLRCPHCGNRRAVKG